MGEPAFHLDAGLNPVGMSMGCSSRLGPPFLGSDGTFLLCGLLEGHDGRHLFHAEWTDEAALIEHPGNHAHEVNGHGCCRTCGKRVECQRCRNPYDEDKDAWGVCAECLPEAFDSDS